MTKHIAPIETHWRGYRFRSRLEARWAVFFDTCGYKWEYEPEGYRVGDDAYLPDFLLPTQGILIEIKPSRFDSLPDDSPEKIRVEILLSVWNAETTNPPPLCLVVGPPRLAEYRLVVCSEHFGDCVFARCRRCDGLCYLGDNGWGGFSGHTCGDHGKWPVADSLQFAYDAASGARFEHGEKPA